MNTQEAEHGTVTYLEKIQFLQNNLLAAHSVWVNDAEVILYDYSTGHLPHAKKRGLLVHFSFAFYWN